MTAPVELEKRHQDRLWIITLNAFNNDTIDTWAQHIRAYHESVAPSNERYLIYVALEARNLSFSSHLREKTIELAQKDRAATGRVAIVIAVPLVMMHIFEVFVSLSTKRLQPHLTVKFFNTLDAAVTWVEEGMDKLT